MAARRYGISTYYIPANASFDTAISQLLGQVQDGLSATIVRLDGVQARLTTGVTGTDAEHETGYWRKHDTVNCSMCEVAWQAGYLGIDGAGNVQCVMCLDCLDALVALASPRGRGE